MARVVFTVARAAGHLSRQSGRGRGRTLPGRVTLALRPRSLAELSARRTVVLISGTNGKSTTTTFLVAALGVRGAVATNSDGANLLAGLATALLPPTDPNEPAVLEVDERALPAALIATQAELVVLLNLSRDQLDRFEEVGSHVSRWTQALRDNRTTYVVANAADPLVVAAVRGARPRDQLVTWVDAGAPWRADAPLCPQCGHAWEQQRTPWFCEVCGLAMPMPAWRLADSSLVAEDGTTTRLHLSIPGRAAAANAAMATAAAALMGLPPTQAIAAISAVCDVDGRYGTTELDGRPVRLLLAKNPAGWLEILAEFTGGTDTMILGINARVADGTDPSWLWDVPFELLRGRRVVVYGERALDLSVRLHYGEIPHDVAADLPTALATTGGGPVCIAANYTAFVGARTGLQLSTP